MRHFAIFGIITSAALSLAACSGAALLNSLTPSSSFERMTDVAFGPLERQKLDIYRAETPREGAPTLVFVHGGSWSEGSKDLYKFIGDSFAKEGFDVVVPNYRLYPEVRYPGMVEDTARAVAYAAEEFGRPVVMIGHSAGGYNVLQTAFAPEIAAEAGLNVCENVAGIVALAPPTGAYELTDEPYVTIFPDRFLGDQAPLYRAKNGMTEVPPILFVHGEDDTTVGPKNSTQLAAVLGPRAQARLYEGRGHIDVVRLLARLFEDDSSIKASVVEFIDGLLLDGGYCAAPE